MIDNRVQSKSDLPRRRGSGSDEVDDEGVETSGKAESRKKKAEIAKRIIACYEYLSTPSATLSVARPSSKRDSYFCLYKIPTKRIPPHSHATRDKYFA